MSSPKCDIAGCGKPMNPIYPTSERTDGSLFENLKTKRAYFICSACEKDLGLIDKKKPVD